MKVLLTGATGFIGKALVVELIKKNFHISIAVRQNSNLFPNKVKQFVVGDFEGNPDFSASLSEVDCVIHLAGKAHVIDKVHLIGQVDNPFYLLKKSDIFVLNSETEGFPNVLIEAMACGLPVISSNCKSGPNEILNNEEFGRLYEVGDIEALAGCIEDTLLLDNSKLKNIRNKNIERANDFDINKSINKFIEVL